MKLTRYEKREMVRTAAEIIDSETGGRAQPLGQERVQSTKGGGKTFLDWALDIKACGPDVFPLYVTESEEPLTHAQRWAIRRFWAEVRGRHGLIKTGLWIMAQMGYETENIQLVI